MLLRLILILFGVFFMPMKQFYISSATIDLLKNEREKTIKEIAKRYDVNENLIRAIIRQESNGDDLSIRYEPHLKQADWYVQWLKPEERDDNFYYCSYGNMHILFAVARKYGFKGMPFDLLQPQNGIAYGVLHLKSLITKYGGNISKAVAAYNAGSAMRGKDGKFSNQEYVDNVMRFYREISGDVIS